MESAEKIDKRRTIPFAIGSLEYKEDQKRRARERWAAKKHQYRKPKVEVERVEGDAPPLPKNLPIVFDIPTDLHDMLGDKLTLSKDWKTWAMFFVRRHKDLSKTTITQYKSYYYKLPQKDIYDVVRYIKTLPQAQRNQAAKAGLSYVSQGLYETIYERKRKGLENLGYYRNELQKMLVFAELSKRTKKESYQAHINQTASAERLEATVSWPDWVNLSARFIKAMLTKKDKTEREKQEVLVAAAYSMLPPVRLDWNDIEIRRTKGGKAFQSLTGEKGKNILFIASKQAVIFWGEFKNIASFPDAPLKQEVPRNLLLVLQKIVADAPVSTPLKLTNFTKFLTGVAEIITGKPFHNTLMRSSYIRNFHDINSKEGVNVEKTKAMMKLLHQSNIEVHLAYNKLHTVNAEMAE